MYKTVNLRYSGDGFWEVRVFGTTRTLNLKYEQLNDRERVAADAVMKLKNPDGTITAAVSFNDFVRE